MRNNRRLTRDKANKNNPKPVRHAATLCLTFFCGAFIIHLAAVSLAPVCPLHLWILFRFACKPLYRHSTAETVSRVLVCVQGPSLLPRTTWGTSACTVLCGGKDLAAPLRRCHCDYSALFLNTPHTPSHPHPEASRIVCL